MLKTIFLFLLTWSTQFRSLYSGISVLQFGNVQKIYYERAALIYKIYRTSTLGMKTARSSEMLVTITQVFRITYAKMQDITCVILSDKCCQMPNY